MHPRLLRTPALALAALLIAAAIAGAPRAHTQSATPADTHYASAPMVFGAGIWQAGAVVTLINAERAKAGCPALSVVRELTAAAQGHAQDMVTNDFFSHTGSDGSHSGDRADAAGYNWSSIAENIAAGQSTPESAVSAWMNSSGHRANILNCSLRDTGVGYVYISPDPGTQTWRYYWVQVFGTRMS